MFELESFLSAWQEAVLGEFGYARVRFLGIQGSRSRGEERPCRSGTSSAASSGAGRSLSAGRAASSGSFAWTRGRFWARSNP